MQCVGRARGRAAQAEGKGSKYRSWAFPTPRKKIRCLGSGEQERNGADYTGFVIRAEEFGETVEVLGDE